MGCHFLLQRIFLAQGSNLGLLHCSFFTIWASRKAPLHSRGRSRVFSSTVWKLQLSGISLLYGPSAHIHTHDFWKTTALTRRTFVGKVMSLLFNTLFRFVIAFLPRSKCLLISWCQSPSAVIMESKKIKSIVVPIVSPCICHEVAGLDAMIFVFWMLSFKPAFSLSSFTFIKRLFSFSFSATRVVSSAYLRLLIFLLAILISACDSYSPIFYMMYSA